VYGLFLRHAQATGLQQAPKITSTFQILQQLTTTL
jgi:hypothetical protein